MITKQELNPKGFTLDEIQSKNIETLLHRINQVRILFAKPMLITSGVRTIEDHLRIYAEKGITDKSKVPMGSMHLIGAACDVLDLKGELMDWCRKNEKQLEIIGLWIEDDPSVPRVHFQIFPPKSGSRFFKP